MKHRQFLLLHGNMWDLTAVRPLGLCVLATNCIWYIFFIFTKEYIGIWTYGLTSWACIPGRQNIVDVFEQAFQYKLLRSCWNCSTLFSWLVWYASKLKKQYYSDKFLGVFNNDVWDGPIVCLNLGSSRISSFINPKTNLRNLCWSYALYINLLKPPQSGISLNDRNEKICANLPVYPSLKYCLQKSTLRGPAGSSSIGNMTSIYWYTQTHQTAKHIGNEPIDYGLWIMSYGLSTRRMNEREQEYLLNTKWIFAECCVVSI